MPAISSSPDAAPSPEADQRELDRRRGRFVPWVIVAFYLTFMSAFIVFMVIAIGHPPEEVTANAYEKGLAYNATLDKAAAQARLGWRSDIRYEGGRLVFRLRDGDGRPLDGAEVHAWFVHPGGGAHDRNLDLRAEGEGLYAAAEALPAGDWTVHVTAAIGDRQYQASSDIAVRP